MRTKLAAVFTIITMSLSMISPLFAQEQWHISVDQEAVKVGYTTVHTDAKPAVPGTDVKVSIDSQGSIGSNYSLCLKDEDDNKIKGIEVTGTISNNREEVKITLPGTLKHGVYDIVLSIDGVEKTRTEIKVLNNVNLGSVVSTDVTGYTGGTWDLVDGLQWAMYTSIANKPTSENPAHFIFDYGETVVNVTAMDLYSTYGKNQGPKTVEIQYWNLETEEWTAVMNGISEEYTLPWNTDAECEAEYIHFDKEYTTNKMRLKVTDSYTSWENTNDIVEVQVWGYKTADLPSIELQQTEGIFGQDNTVTLSLRNKKVSEEIQLELVNALTKTSLEQPLKYKTNTINGKLQYDFVIPANVPVGKYCMHVTSDTLDLFSNEYVINLNQNKYIKNSSSYLKVSMLEKETPDTLSNIIDSNIHSSWQSPTLDFMSLLFEVQPENNRYASLILKDMKVYADPTNIDTVTLKSIANTNYYRNIDTTQNGLINTLVSLTPEWNHDGGGDFFTLSPGYLSFGNIYILDIKTKDEKKVTIYEIETNAIHIKDNILNEAKVYHNDKEVDASQMFNNNISSYYKTVKGIEDTYVLDFSPREITTDELLYTSHFPQSQGLSQVTLEYWNGNAWVQLNQYDFKYKTNNEIREVKQLLFDTVSTSKIRLTVNDANAVWDNSYLFTKLNVIGEIQTNAQYIADQLDTNIVINQGDTKIKLPELDSDIKDSYTVSMHSSSVEEILALSGDINSMDKDSTVNISLKVASKDGKDVGITKIFPVIIPKKVTPGNTLITPAIDIQTIYNNPAMGWVQYYEFQNTDVDVYWAEMDALYAEGLKTNILYIRNPWSWYEPEEGKYAWDDPNSQLGKLISGARERGIQLAFRVLLDSSDAFQQSTPEYVFEAGALSYETDKTDPTAPDIDSKDPYINDPIFLEKLGVFLQAFGEEFNNNLDIAFIDGMGFGNWGEVHHMKYHTNWDDNVDDAIEKIVDLYNRNFPDVLLGAQEGQPENYGTEQSEEYIDNLIPYTGAFRKPYDFMVRRDTFGWMTDAIRKQTIDWFNQGIPIFAENCYHSFQIREYWYNNAGFPTLDGILKQVVSDALECRANTLDARVVMDCQSWLQNDKENGSGLLDKFGINGGYRHAPTSIEIPSTLEVGEDITVHHAWRNYGVGVLPNTNMHWDNKYHVAFALLDPTTNEVVYQYNESTDNVNPGDWLLEDGNNRYRSKFRLPAYMQSGEYKLAVSIVNHKNDNQPEIDLAIQNPQKTTGGWYILDTVNVHNSNLENTTHKIIIDPTDNGIVKADTLEVKHKSNVTLQFLPNEGYIVNTVYINEIKVDSKNNTYTIENIQEDQHVQVTFIKDHSKPIIKGINTNTGDHSILFGYILLLLISAIGYIKIRRIMN